MDVGEDEGVGAGYGGFEGMICGCEDCAGGVGEGGDVRWDAEGEGGGGGGEDGGEEGGEQGEENRGWAHCGMNVEESWFKVMEGIW